jgi:hypothetical protein
MKTKGKKRFIGGLVIAGGALLIIEIWVKPMLDTWSQQLGSFLGQMAMAATGVPEQYRTLQTVNTVLWVVVLAGVALAAWGWHTKKTSQHSLAS